MIFDCMFGLTEHNAKEDNDYKNTIYVPLCVVKNDTSLSSQRNY